MEKIVIFLNKNKIAFNTIIDDTVYTILVSYANEQQSSDLIDLAEAQGLVYKIRGGIAIHEELPKEKKTTK